MPHTRPAPLAEGPRVGIRPYTYEDAAEFTTRARESGALHRPWLFPPTTAETYTAYARTLIEDPTKAGCLVYDRADGALAGSSTSTTSSRAASGAGPSATARSRTRRARAHGGGARARRAPRLRELRLHRLEINVQPRNAASIALARRAGFRLEGFSPRFLFIDGAWRDHQRWALTTEMTPAETLG
ncbi:acetyltransferase [Streptomyces alboflavus]|uniref:Acetyltransferase n=1 Tax=Streptomyces alboflavus TaxID=67267 RepID=A0A1Z1WM86_9ACTN|nr:GNAT family protein [Streptomyces alboflavus]ARX87564.1 acetyltransferase [Streptomyces alboflavus]